jgi:hypothetical protein
MTQNTRMAWLPPTTPGSLLTLDAPSIKPKWLLPGTTGQMLMIGAGGLPAWTTVAGVILPISAPGDLIAGNAAGVASRFPRGATGQVLSTAATGLLAWIDPPSGGGSMSNPMTSVGDLIRGDAGGTPVRLGVGTDGYVLTVLGGLPAWAAPPGAGNMSNPMTALGDLITGAAAGAPQKLGIGPNGYVLTAVAGVPAWAVLPAPGMGNPMTTVGDLIVGQATGTPSRLPLGTVGQVLRVVAGSAAWANPDAPGMANPMTAAGDVIVGTTGGVPARLPIGATVGHVLTIAGAGVLGWAPAPGGGGVTFPLLAPDGTLAAPPYAFAAASGTGLARNLGGGGALNVVVGGTLAASVLAGSVTLNGTLQFAPDNTYDIGQPTDLRPRDLYLIRNATVGNTLSLGPQSARLTSDTFDVLAQRNGTTPQTSRIYETFTDIANGAALELIGGATMYVRTIQTGTGLARPLVLGTTGAASLQFMVGSTPRWMVDTDGSLKAVTDNAYDLGSATLRPRDLYVGRAVTMAVLGTAPATPSTGQVVVYAKSDKLLYQKDDTGLETGLAGGGGGGMTNPMTTPWDLIVGGAAGVPTRFAKGADFQVLTMITGALSWQNLPAAGMANPMTAVGDLIVGTTLGAPSRRAIGSAGTVLTVVGGVPTWQAPAAPGMGNPMSAVGDLIVGGASGGPQRLGIGTTDYVLTVVGGTPTWRALPAPTGITWPVLAPDGSAAAPSYSFASNTGHGLYIGAGGHLYLTAGSPSTLLVFARQNVVSWWIDVNHGFQPGTDTAMDLGGSANRVRDLWLSRLIDYTALASAPATPAAGHVVTYAKTDKKMYQKDDAGVETPLGGSGGGGAKYVPLRIEAATLPDGTTGSATAELVREAAAASGNMPGPTKTMARFDKDVDEHLMWSFMLPSDYASGGTVRLKWKVQSTATGNVIWKAGIAISTDGSVEVSVATVTLAAASAATGTPHVVIEVTLALTMTGAAANRYAQVFIGRDADNAADTLAVDACLLGARFEYA